MASVRMLCRVLIEHEHTDLADTSLSGGVTSESDNGGDLHFDVERVCVVVWCGDISREVVVVIVDGTRRTRCRVRRSPLWLVCIAYQLSYPGEAGSIEISQPTKGTCHRTALQKMIVR